MGDGVAVFDAGLFPSAHRPWRQWVADHNPCLLLSTVCMLLGCFLVNSALRAESSNLKMLALLGVINVYEACIIPLGLVLIRRARGTARDGWWLILFEMLFLVNATFVNPDFGPGWAMPLSGVLWVLACVKAAILLRGLKIGLSVRTFGFLALQLGIIYALPVVFALTKVDGHAPVKVMYGLWWVVGLLPVAYDVMARVWWRHEPWDLVQNVVRRVYVIAPWCMLVVHMGFAHWAHQSDFAGADVAPLLLGLAAMTRRLDLTPSWRMAIRFAPAAALLLALIMPGEGVRWVMTVGGLTKEVTAGHVMLAGTILTYGYMGTMWQLAAAAGTVMVMGLGYMFIGWIMEGVGAAMRVGTRTTWEWLPKTVFAWGVTAIGAAFGLLGLGTWLGLRRKGGQGNAKC
jgi:hypothetical protein